MKEKNSEKRQRLIDEYYASDFKIGDAVQVQGKYLSA